jgi:hypothetical protein
MATSQPFEFSGSEHRDFHHGYSVTSHSSQGMTAERVLVNADTGVHPDPLTSRFGYVSISAPVTRLSPNRRLDQLSPQPALRQVQKSNLDVSNNLDCEKHSLAVLLLLAVFYTPFRFIHLRSRLAFRSSLQASRKYSNFPVQQPTGGDLQLAVVTGGNVQLSDRYGFVPPVEGVDKLRSGHRVGAQIVSLMLKHLLTKSLTTQSFATTAYRTVIDSVFLRSWRLVELSGTHYAPQVPTNARVKTAWDAIDVAVPLAPDGEKRIAFSEIWKLLSSEPFGYSDLTFTALMGAWISVHRAELHVDVVRRSPGHPSIHQEVAIAPFFQSSEMDAPAKLVSSWQREDLFLIRRSAITDVSVPPRLSVDDGKAALLKIQEFLSGEPSNVVRVNELRNAAKVIRFEIDQIEKWEEQCRSDLSQIDSADLAHIVDTFGILQSAPNYAGKRFEVHLTEAQMSARLAGIENARSLIQLRVAETQRKAGVIATDEDFRAITGQIERDHEILRRDEALSRAFSDQLEAARRIAENRFESLSRQTRFEQTLRNVKNVIGALSQATTQTALANAQHAIEHYAEECPEIVSSREYRNALGHIETFKLGQKSWLAECKSRADLVKSKRESETLLAEIRGNTERFDIADDAAQLSAISAMLADAARRFERIEGAEGILNSFLSAVRGASQRVFRAKDAASSLTEYRELANCECGNVEEARTKSQVLSECEKIKRDVIESINQRVRTVSQRTRCCNRGKAFPSSATAGLLEKCSNSNHMERPKRAGLGGKAGNVPFGRRGRVSPRRNHGGWIELLV